MQAPALPSLAKYRFPHKSWGLFSLGKHLKGITTRSYSDDVFLSTWERLHGVTTRPSTCADFDELATSFVLSFLLGGASVHSRLLPAYSTVFGKFKPALKPMLHVWICYIFALYVYGISYIICPHVCQRLTMPWNPKSNEDLIGRLPSLSTLLQSRPMSCTKGTWDLQ